jgi:hypothetical protein
MVKCIGCHLIEGFPGGISMKRWVLALISIIMLLGLTCCASAPESKDPGVGVPEETYDLVYDMKNYDHFTDIFDEKSIDEWTSMGRYTMLLNGLHTPVVVNMDGTDVLTIGAYDQTVELGMAGLADEYHDGFSPVYYIGSTQDAVVIRVSGGESSDDSILITKDRYYTFQQENDCNTNFFVREDGTLEYCRTWNDPIGFEQMGFDALAYCTSRDELLYETGHAEIVDDDLILTAEETVLLSDAFDLDALFAEAQAAGAFEEYDSVDALLAANQASANED